ncbi:MAG: right-handed parallel beta-helix repeat-containing protein [Nanoarchaeota archaeon]
MGIGCRGPGVFCDPGYSCIGRYCIKCNDGICHPPEGEGGSAPCSADCGYEWTGCVDAYETSCEDVCASLGKSCSDSCTSLIYGSGYVNYQSRWEYSGPSACSTDLWENSWSTGDCSYTNRNFPYSSDPSARWKCCCSAEYTEGDANAEACSIYEGTFGDDLFCDQGNGDNCVCNDFLPEGCEDAEYCCGDDDEEFPFTSPQTGASACCEEATDTCVWTDASGNAYCNDQSGHEGDGGDYGSCSGGLDEDCDTLIDCGDQEDCCSQPECSDNPACNGYQDYGEGETCECKSHTDCTISMECYFSGVGESGTYFIDDLTLLDGGKIILDEGGYLEISGNLDMRGGSAIHKTTAAPSELTLDIDGNARFDCTDSMCEIHHFRSSSDDGLPVRILVAGRTDIIGGPIPNVPFFAAASGEAQPPSPAGCGDENDYSDIFLDLNADPEQNDIGSFDYCGRLHTPPLEMLCYYNNPCPSDRSCIEDQSYPDLDLLPAPNLIVNPGFEISTAIGEDPLMMNPPEVQSDTNPVVLKVKTNKDADCRAYVDDDDKPWEDMEEMRGQGTEHLMINYGLGTTVQHYFFIRCRSTDPDEEVIQTTDPFSVTTGGRIHCSSCEECTWLLENEDIEVSLSQNIIDVTDNCINISAAGVVLDGDLDGESGGDKYQIAGRNMPDNEYAVKLLDASNIEIKNIIFSGFFYGLYSVNSNGLNVDSCVFNNPVGNSRRAIYVQGIKDNSGEIVISGNSFTSKYQSVVISGRSEGERNEVVSIIDNHFNNFVPVNHVIVNNVRDFTFSGNEISSATLGRGLEIDYVSSSISLINNIISNLQWGIYIHGEPITPGFDIRGNTVCCNPPYNCYDISVENHPSPVIGHDNTCTLVGTGFHDEGYEGCTNACP